MYSGSVNGALGLSGRTDAIHTSRSGDGYGNARTSTVLTTENTAVVAPIVSASVPMTVAANAGARTYWRTAIRRSFNRACIDTGPSQVAKSALTCRDCEDPFDLPEVIEVVAGEHPHDLLDSFLPALGVHAVVHPLLGIERVEQLGVRVAQPPELRVRSAGIARIVMAPHHPANLIEGKNRHARRSENQADPKGADDLSVGEVRDDLADRPLVRRRARAQRRHGHGVDQMLEPPRRRRQHVERLLALEVSENPLRVLLRSLAHTGNPRRRVHVALRHRSVHMRHPSRSRVRRGRFGLAERLSDAA